MAAEFTTFHMTKDRWFEVVRTSDGTFYQCDGFETEADAVAKARELVVRYPSETFYIMAPVKVVRADIPVIEEEFVATNVVTK